MGSCLTKKSWYNLSSQVETIGDAYMVASGIPLVNEHHASEIAAMALDLNEKVFVTFRRISNQYFKR